MTGESWEDQTMRGNRLLPTCHEAKDALQAQGIDPQQPAQATAPDLWDDALMDLALIEQRWPLPARRIVKAHAVALAAERASSEVEVDKLKARLAEAETDFQSFAGHHAATERSLAAKDTELLTREREAFMAGCEFMMDQCGVVREKDDDQWLDEAFTVHRAQREAKS